MILNSIKSIFVAFLFLAGSTLWAANFDLSALSLEKQEDVYKLLGKSKGDNFSAYEMDLTLKYLAQKEDYNFIEIDLIKNESGSYYRLKTDQIKRIRKIQFLGNKVYSESELKRFLSIPEKSAFEQQAFVESADRIRDFYKERGFFNTVLNLEIINVSSNEIDLKISINENQKSILKSIMIKSKSKDLNAFLEKKLGKYLNDPFTNSLIYDIKKKARELLNEEHRFRGELSAQNIKSNKDETEIYLEYNLDFPEQYEFKFEGNRQLSTNQLEEVLDLENYFTSNPSIGPELLQKIKNKYLANGYSRIEIAVEEFTFDLQYKKTLVFKINEGPQVRIGSISISGKYNESNEYYVKFIRSHSSDVIADDIYYREDFELGLKNLITERRNLGYFRAKILSTKTIYNKEKNQVQITVNLDEGPLTKIAKVSFEGNNSYSDEKLKEILGLKAGEPLKLNQFEEAIEKLKSFYKNSGYLEMALLNERNDQDDLITYEADNTLGSIQLKIYEGPKIYVAAILIDGNTITQNFVIQNELDFKVGDILTPQLIEESTKRLQRTGYFNAIDIKTQEEKTQISQRTVVVRVLDRDPGLFTFGIGVNNERKLTVRGYSGVAYRNLFGTGRGISARLEGNQNIAEVKFLERKVTLGYLEPYIFDSRFRGRVNLTRSLFVSDFVKRMASEVDQITFSIEKDITSHILFSWDLWSLAHIRDYSIDNDPNLPDSNSDIATIGPSFDFDFRDHPFNPTKGTFSRIDLEYSSPELGSNRTVNYIKSSASFTHYFKLSSNSSWVWANSFRHAFLKNLSQAPTGGVPYDKKGLLLGGQSTIRGFQYGEAFPNAYDLGTATKLTTQEELRLIKSELRFPIKGNFVGALFYDGGSVTIKDINITDPWRDAAGIAFRYSTPVGAVSFEWAYKLDRNVDRNESQLGVGNDWTKWLPTHFSIGTF